MCVFVRVYICICFLFGITFLAGICIYTLTSCFKEEWDFNDKFNENAYVCMCVHVHVCVCESV